MLHSDVLTLLALALFAYVLFREGGSYLSGISERIKSSVTGAKKPVAYLLMLLTAAFVLGELYAVWVSGRVLPSADAFWLPFWILLILVLYNYL
ncbi:TPA: hypothetical protein EYP13_03475 [Candidatus Micrarchaeota archaeon]|nr:hypothetical protein [Candidatus Micrarchaeota archaeon]